MARLSSSPFSGTPSFTPNQKIRELSKPHVQSFNYILRGGLRKAVTDIHPVQFALPKGDKIKLYISDAQIFSPQLPPGTARVSDMNIYPAECRQRKITYRGQLIVKLEWAINDVEQPSVERNLGQIPIMLMSDVCNLSKLKPAELIKHGEEENAFGGYFIINGLEKFIRMLTVPRRNYPLACVKPSWKNRGRLYSEFGISIRCVREDHTANNMILHYLTDGTCKLMFFFRKEMFFVPVILILKALCTKVDYYIYNQLIAGVEDDSYFKGCVRRMLREVQNQGLLNQEMVCDYIGQMFRVKLMLPEWYTNAQVTEFLLHECVCIHLDSNEKKFDLLVFMTRKLFALSQNKCAEENLDSPMNHEVLLGGQLYLLLLKERLSQWLWNIRTLLDKKAKTLHAGFTLEQKDILFASSKVSDLSKSMEYLLATGNLVTKHGLGLLQATGLAIILDKINYLRFISHFHSVHRGAHFADMRTTSVRRLRPEAWGFICPVHTPDGAPCGLLNHLSILCHIVPPGQPTTHLKNLLLRFGVSHIHEIPPESYDKCYSVILDGEVFGFVAKSFASKLCDMLRFFKTTNHEHVTPYLEIVLVPETQKQSLYPGLFLFTTPARMMRAVKNLATKTNEFIGTFEQIYLNICISRQEFIPKVTTHMELKKTSIISLMANLVPFSNYNQSPRNMYQCQMAKQTMGTPDHALFQKPDTKTYRLQTPQSPLVRSALYDEYQLDDYCCGTNAIVAVISYTGYDMEDAMVINKASLDRGFAHCTIYKSELIDLPKISSCQEGQVAFGIKQGDKFRGKDIRLYLDSDGLPYVGSLLEYDKPFYSYINFNTGNVKVMEYHGQEDAYVDCVRLLGDESATPTHHRAHITLRVVRNPTVGDKFANRHGQKGVCSMRFPMEDMPFTDTGMIPDIIFNPHGISSRMTIGMIIEAMAGKSAACHGFNHDSAPFTFSESDSAINFFGNMLEKAGFNYYGNERLYSGIDGQELVADIFFGVIYYQRLRHMVADKFQVRSTGPIDAITHQPIKGRKRGGGIRFGEMERDSLIAHGTANLLRDRLFSCSDKSLEYLCTKCGCLLSPIFQIPLMGNTKIEDAEYLCSLCNSKKYIELVTMPFVFKYLVCELAAVNIHVELNVHSK